MTRFAERAYNFWSAFAGTRPTDPGTLSAFEDPGAVVSVASPAASAQTSVAQLLAQGRSALLLRAELARSLGADEWRRAHEQLTAQAVLITGGPVRLEAWAEEDEEQPSEQEIVTVEPFYLDRYPVTNGQYAEFVRAGGYQQPAFWDPTIVPNLGALVDRSGRPGPSGWEQGCPPRGSEKYPVVGVCWYEAAAYARWVGKRLPSDPEWVRAACCPMLTAEGRLVQQRYPWGDVMEASRVNVGHGSSASLAPVDAFPRGASVAGVQQLVGNVWEWMAEDANAWTPVHGTLEHHWPLKSLRGAAYDTYFESHAQPQFASADHVLARKRNIGFRCAVSLESLTLPGSGDEGEA